MSAKPEEYGNAGIRITIDETVLDALDQLHQRVTDAGILIFCRDYLKEKDRDEGLVCLRCAKEKLDESCNDFQVIFDAIGWTSDDRRERQVDS